MKKITIGFSKSIINFPVWSWLIRWYLKTPYSHVFIKFYSENIERELIYESVGKQGVRFINKSNWEKKSKLVKEYKIEINDDNYKKILQWCIDNSGEEYALYQNIGVVISDILKLNKNPAKKGMNCSEAIYYILKLEGYKIDKEPNLITPKDIDELLSR